MRKAFRLRSQGQPFKMMGAEQLTQPLQQGPVQPLYSNPNDPAQQQQGAPLQQIVTQSDDLDAASENTEPKKSGTGSKILKGAADIMTGALDRVYGSGKTNILANEKAAEYASIKSEEAKKALAEKRAHELEVIKLGTNKKATSTKETPEEKAERERKEELNKTTNAIDNPAKQVDPSMIMGLVGSMGGGKKEEEKKEQPNWKANVKVS